MLDCPLLRWWNLAGWMEGTCCLLVESSLWVSPIGQTRCPLCLCACVYVFVLDHVICQEGLAQLAKTFSEYSVLPVKVEKGLHLKSFMSMVGPDKIGIGQSPGARMARDQIRSGAKYTEKYEFVEFPDDTAANCLYIGGNLVHVSREVAPNSADILSSLSVPGKKYSLNVSELGKVDGCLTCSSLLIKLKK